MVLGHHFMTQTGANHAILDEPSSRMHGAVVVPFPEKVKGHV